MGAIANAVEESKRKVLEIGAQAGDQGVRAYNEAQETIRQTQQDALKRAHAASSLIGASHVNATIDETIRRPTSRILSSMDAANVQYKQGRAANQASNLSYLEGIKGLEGWVDFLNAQKAAEDAAARGGGGGGGGGRGGGGRGGGGDYSDSELRVRVTGAAQIARQQAASAMAGRAGEAAGKARKASKQQHAAARKLKGRGRYAQTIYRQDPSKAGRGSGVRNRLREQQQRAAELERKIARANRGRGRGAARGGYVVLPDGTRVRPGTNRYEQSFGDKRLGELPNGNGIRVVSRGSNTAGQPTATDALGRRLAATRRSIRRLTTTRDLAEQRASAGREALKWGTKAGKRENRARRIASAPISGIARDIAINEYGLDPDLAFGLVSEKDDASFGRASDYLGERANPSKWAVAQGVNLSPEQVSKVRQGKTYRQTMRSASDAAAQSVPWEQFYAQQLAPLAKTKGGKKLVRILQYELKPLFLTAGQQAGAQEWQLEQNAYEESGVPLWPAGPVE